MSYIITPGQGTVLCPTLLASSSDENGNVTHNIADDTITYVYDSEYNSTTGTQTGQGTVPRPIS